MKAIKGLHPGRGGAGQANEARRRRRRDARSVGEFLLEGLYVNNRLSKFNSQGKTFFKK